YRTIVGKIMYLTHKLLPECVNASRELTKFFQRPGKEHWNALIHLVGYLKGEKENLKMTFHRPKDIRYVGVVNSNFATGKELCRSVSGSIMTLGGCIIGWFSSSQKQTTLLSTEAKYYALSLAAQDLLFV